MKEMHLVVIRPPTNRETRSCGAGIFSWARPALRIARACSVPTILIAFIIKRKKGEQGNLAKKPDAELSLEPEMRGQGKMPNAKREAKNMKLPTA